jgi:hypothetical protein
MSAFFGFFLRLFICFVAAKFLLNAVGVTSREYLVVLTGLLLANVYWLSHLLFREQRPFGGAAGGARADPGLDSRHFFLDTDFVNVLTFVSFILAQEPSPP